MANLVYAIGFLNSIVVDILASCLVTSQHAFLRQYNMEKFLSKPEPVNDQDLLRYMESVGHG